ncbi:MAG TPA: hypothetical protein EYP19_16760, partial [Desulfobacterales bacterium]|nr:hypothetical protein [Desulfobacterales bacterium]
MEDLSRNLAQRAKVRNPGHPRKVPRRWTLLLIGEVGKVFSFHLTKSLLLALPALLAAVIAAATYSVVSYNALRVENSQLRDDLDMLRVKLETAEKAREKASVRLMVLEDRARQSLTKANPASARNTKEATSKVTKPKTATNGKPSKTPKPIAQEIAEPKAPQIPKPVAAKAATGEPSETVKP